MMDTCAFTAQFCVKIIILFSYLHEKKMIRHFRYRLV